MRVEVLRDTKRILGVRATVVSCSLGSPWNPRTPVSLSETASSAGPTDFAKIAVSDESVLLANLGDMVNPSVEWISVDDRRKRPAP